MGIKPRLASQHGEQVPPHHKAIFAGAQSLNREFNIAQKAQVICDGLVVAGSKGGHQDWE